MDDRLRRVATWTLLLSAFPAASLTFLASVGLAPPWFAVASIAATVAVAWVAIRRWDDDIRILAETAQRAGWSSAASDPTPTPSLLSARAAHAEIGRLAAKLSERAGLIETLLGAEEAIVERLPDPLILLGADRAVRRANEAARSTFGAEIAAVLRHPSLRVAIDAAIRQAGSARDAAVEPAHRAQTQAARVDLSLGLPVERDVVATVITLHPPLPGGGTVLIVLSDRTRERAIERTRSDFIANASHELRTPLASLIGFIETLRGPAADDPPAQARFLGIMAEQAARMNRLIDDLLSLSRIEISEHQPPQTRVDPVPLIQRAASGFEPRVAMRGQTLRVDAPDRLPAILADEDQITQVLDNLLDNACKYGREGGLIVLAAEAAASEALPPRQGVLISVSDDGPGIARGHLPRLTERFYRAEPGRGGRGPSGTGLGLAIVKHIVNRHRGALRIESEPGSGAVFKIWLPCA